MRYDFEQVELEKVLPNLLAEERSRDIQERRNARVAHEMRHVRVPTPHTNRTINTSPIATGQQQKPKKKE